MPWYYIWILCHISINNVYGCNLCLLWSALKHRMPQNFRIANFGHPVSLILAKTLCSGTIQRGLESPSLAEINSELLDLNVFYPHYIEINTHSYVMACCLLFGHSVHIIDIREGFPCMRFNYPLYHTPWTSVYKGRHLNLTLGEGIWISPWQSGKQNRTLTCPAWKVMFWAESSQGK